MYILCGRVASELSGSRTGVAELRHRFFIGLETYLGRRGPGISGGYGPRIIGSVGRVIGGRAIRAITATCRGVVRRRERGFFIGLIGDGEVCTLCVLIGVNKVWWVGLGGGVGIGVLNCGTADRSCVACLEGVKIRIKRSIILCHPLGAAVSIRGPRLLRVKGRIVVAKPIAVLARSCD